jgi:hypothetical protein
MSLRRIRLGELLALAGAACVIVALTRNWYEGPYGTLNAWDTFGASIILLMTAACAALALVVSAATERSTALPVSIAVWGVLLGLVAVIAAVVRLLDTPEHTTKLCAGPWLALAGAVLILLGAWESLRDERPSLYTPANPEPRPRP